MCIRDSIDTISGRFIPSSHTPEETAYLDAYATAMEDMIITPEERKLLNTIASTYGLSDKIVKQLETEYDTELGEDWLTLFTREQRDVLDGCISKIRNKNRFILKLWVIYMLDEDFTHAQKRVEDSYQRMDNETIRKVYAYYCLLYTSPSPRD